jgi:putative transcriptional regulator
MRAFSFLGAAAAACALAAAGAALGPPEPDAVAGIPPWLSTSPRDLAKGKFLIAQPQAGGPYFYESVVLLLDYEPEGAVGLIVNRPTDIELTRLLPDIEALQGRSDRAFFGGPVERERMMVLYRAGEAPPDARQIVGEIYASGSFGTLRQAIESGTPPSRLRAYVGYAGWGMGQLQGEVARGDWLIAPAEADAVFEMDPDEVWREFIERSTGLHAERGPEGESGRIQSSGSDSSTRISIFRD